jgi:hypothetical protein
LGNTHCKYNIAPYLLITRQTVAFNREAPYVVDSKRFTTAVSAPARGGSPGYARECCLIRELTEDERELFGLPAR